jgi:hypothetical protein
MAWDQATFCRSEATGRLRGSGPRAGARAASTAAPARPGARARSCAHYLALTHDERARGEVHIRHQQHSSPTRTPNEPNPSTETNPHGAFVTQTGPPVDTFIKALEKSGGVIPGATAQAERAKAVTARAST